MEKHNEFEAIKIDHNEIFIICKTYESFIDFYPKIERYLNKISFNGIIYIDQLSLVNNNYNRFSKIEFINNKLDFKNAKHIDLNKTYKKITSNFFYNNQNLLENTLIIKENKEKIINKEIV